MGNKPFAVLPKQRPERSTEAQDQAAHDKEVARDTAALETKKELARDNVDKVTALLFGVEPMDCLHGKMWGWFTRPGEQGEDVAMYVADFFDVDRNRHLPDLKASVAIDRFTDCYSNEDAERRHHVALRKKLLNAHGIRYIVMHRGKGGSLLDAPVQLLSQDV